MWWKTKNKSEKREAKEIQRTPSNHDKPVNQLFTVVVVTTGLILLSCTFMFYQTCMTSLSHKECDHRWMELRDSIYDDIEHVDSIFSTRIQVSNTKTTSVSKSFNRSDGEKYIFTRNDIENIKKAQKTLIARQDKMADDLRQETNNMINKVNGWLSFWMGVMAVLGVFVPIALQFKLYRETRDSDRELKKQHEEDRHRVEDCLRQTQADIRGEYVRVEAKIKSEHARIEAEIQRTYKKIIGELTQEVDLLKFSGSIKSFQNLADCPSLSNNETRGLLMRNNWDEIVRITKSVINSYIHDIDRSDKNLTYPLSIILIQTADVLATIRKLYPHRSRRLQTLMEQSYRIVTQINSTSYDRNAVNTELTSYSESLSILAPFTI